MPMYGGYGGPGDTFLKGYQIGLEGSLRRQQLESQRELQKQQMAATAQHMALLLDQHNQQVQYQADMSKATAAALMESATPSPRDTTNDPGGESSDPSQGISIQSNPNSIEFLNAFAKNALPVVAKYQPDKVRDFQASITSDALNLAKAQDELKKARDEASFKPGYATTINPDTGKPETFWQGGPKSGQRIVQPSMQTFTDPVTGQTQEMIQTGPNSWRPKPQDVAQRSTDLANLKSRLDQQKQRHKVIQESGIEDGLQESVDPTTGAVVTTEKPGAYEEALKRKAGALVPSEKAKVQAQVLAGSKLADSAREMAQSFNDLNVGPVGAFQNIAEKLKAMANLPIGDQSTTGTRAAMARFREGLASLGASQGLNAGTKQRLQLLMHNAPDAESFISGAPTVKLQTAEVLTQVANDMKENFIALQRPIPDQWEQPEKIRDRVANGEITAEEGRKLLSENIRAMANQFKRAAELGK